jgi:hypothetical protein
MTYNQTFSHIYLFSSRPQKSFHPPSTNFRQTSLSFISCNLSYKQNIYSFLCFGVPSRSDASTQHHVLPTSQEFPIPLRLPTSILCHIASRLQISISFACLLFAHTQITATRSFRHVRPSITLVEIYWLKQK